jgi:tetratricopeptide (TPR) repeat protein
VKAEPLYREALGVARAIHPGDHQNTATCLIHLSLNLMRLQRLPEAEAFAREGVEMAHRLYGDHHDEMVSAWRTLAAVLRAQGRLDESERLMRAALTQAQSLFGDGNPTLLVISRGLASVLEQQRRFPEALELRRDELVRTTKVLGEADVYVAIGLAGLGRHGLASGQLDLAETYFRQALEVRRKIHPGDHWRVDEARGMLGLALLRRGRMVEAEVDLLAAYAGLRAHRSPGAEETERARTALVELYERWNRPEHARQYRNVPR